MRTIWCRSSSCRRLLYENKDEEMSVRSNVLEFERGVGGWELPWSVGNTKAVAASKRRKPE